MALIDGRYRGPHENEVLAQFLQRRSEIQRQEREQEEALLFNRLNAIAVNRPDIAREMAQKNPAFRGIAEQYMPDLLGPAPAPTEMERLAAGAARTELELQQRRQEHQLNAIKPQQQPFAPAGDFSEAWTAYGSGEAPAGIGESIRRDTEQLLAVYGPEGMKYLEEATRLSQLPPVDQFKALRIATKLAADGNTELTQLTSRLNNEKTNFTSRQNTLSNIAADAPRKEAVTRSYETLADQREQELSSYEGVRDTKFKLLMEQRKEAARRVRELEQKLFTTNVRGREALSERLKEAQISLMRLDRELNQTLERLPAPVPTAQPQEIPSDAEAVIDYGDL